ncbi:MAG: glycosyltransferase [Bacteroidota bacterium]|nr:glycosyltransferase [Bacteroidota bacterium]
MYHHVQAISKKFNVTVLSIEKDSTLKNTIEIVKEKQGSVNVYLLYYNWDNNVSFYFRFKLIIRFFKLFIGILKTFQLIEDENGFVDKVHLNVSHPLGIVALYLKFIKSKTYYITEHSTLFVLNHYKSYSFFGKLIIKLTYRFTSGLSVVTNYLGQSILRLGLFKSSYHVIPNVVSTEFFNLKNLNNSKDEPVFIHVSTLRPSKGVDMLLDACKILNNQGVKYRFVIVGGTGGYLSHVQNKINALNLNNNVYTTGELNPNEIATFLKQADFFVLNSEFETFCVVMIEAMACGLPVIAPNNTAIPENMNSQRGLLLLERTPEVWAKALVYMIENYKSYDKREMYQFVENTFSYEGISRKFELLFKG